jgi:hypothetical protein
MATYSPLDFSRYGDRVFSRFAEQFPHAQRRRLLLDQALSAEHFAQIRAHMLSYLGAVLGASKPLTEDEAIAALLAKRGALPSYTRGGMLAPTREHTLEFNALHQSVAAAVSQYVMPDQVDGIDLPINVRLVYGETDATRNNAPFSSTKLHSDVWAGVPMDAIVCVLPVLGDIDNLTIECCEMEPQEELAAMHAFAAYDDANPQITPSKWYSDAAMQLGHLYLADVRLLHRTIRRQSRGARVSIDFRLRYNDATYRSMLPEVGGTGPDAADTRVPYPEWQRVGREKLIVFDQSLADLGSGITSSSPVNTASYRLMPLW